MPSTQPPALNHSFNEDPAPQEMVNAAALDTQLRIIVSSIAALINDLKVSIRDDNTLSDALVRIRNLHPELSTYLDSRLTGTVLTQNVTYLTPVKCATTANLAALVSNPLIDGVTLFENDRVLVKDQINKAQNGVWIVKVGSNAGVWVRADDLLDGAAISSNVGVIVSLGVSQNGSVWQLRPEPTTTNPDVYPTNPIVGTGPQGWFQIYGPFPIPVSKGGTGATTPNAARDNLNACGKEVVPITGDGVTTTFTVIHNLNTQSVMGFAVDDVTNETHGISVVGTSLTTCTVTFTLPPAIGQVHRIIVIG